MRFGSQSSARPQFYDRSPAVKSVSISVNVNGGTVGVIEGTYDVPVNRKAIIETVVMEFHSTVVPTTAVLCFASLFHYAGGLQIARIASVYSNDATVNVPHFIDQDLAAILLPTDGLKFIVYNPNTGGTIQFNLDAEVIEFDA